MECPRPPASGGTGGDQESPPRKCQRPQAEAWPPASTTHRLRASSVTAIHASTHFRVDICPGQRSAASALQPEDTVPPPSGHTHPLSPARGTLLRDATQDPPSVPPSSRRGPIAATPQSRKLAVQLGRPTLPVCPETLATLATGQTPGEGQALTRRRCGKAGEPQEFWRGLGSQPTGQPSRSLSEHWPPVSPGVTSVRSGEAQSETSGGGTGVGVCHLLPQQNLIQAPSVGDAPAPGHSPGPRGPMDLGGRSREGLSTPLHPLPQGKRGLPSSKNS